MGSFATPEIKFGVRAVIQYPLLGWVDEIRFSKGIARWTSGFTPSTSAYSLTINNIGEYVSVADSYSQSSDVSAWSDINSSTVTETLNAQNAYYWYSFDPASSYGAGTEIVVPKPVVHTYGSDVTSGQTFTASASNSAGENQDKAFDDNASTYWNPTNSSAVPQWIKVN